MNVAKPLGQGVHNRFILGKSEDNFHLLKLDSLCFVIEFIQANDRMDAVSVGKLSLMVER